MLRNTNVQVINSKNKLFHSKKGKYQQVIHRKDSVKKSGKTDKKHYILKEKRCKINIQEGKKGKDQRIFLRERRGGIKESIERLFTKKGRTFCIVSKTTGGRVVFYILSILILEPIRNSPTAKHQLPPYLS